MLSMIFSTLTVGHTLEQFSFHSLFIALNHPVFNLTIVISLEHVEHVAKLLDHKVSTSVITLNIENLTSLEDNTKKFGKQSPLTTVGNGCAFDIRIFLDFITKNFQICTTGTPFIDCCLFLFFTSSLVTCRLTVEDCLIFVYRINKFLYVFSNLIEKVLSWIFQILVNLVVFARIIERINNRTVKSSLKFLGKLEQIAYRNNKTVRSFISFVILVIKHVNIEILVDVDRIILNCYEFLLNFWQFTINFDFDRQN